MTLHSQLKPEYKDKLVKLKPKYPCSTEKLEAILNKHAYISDMVYHDVIMLMQYLRDKDTFSWADVREMFNMEVYNKDENFGFNEM